MRNYSILSGFFYLYNLTDEWDDNDQIRHSCESRNFIADYLTINLHLYFLSEANRNTSIDYPGMRVKTNEGNYFPFL